MAKHLDPAIFFEVEEHIRNFYDDNPYVQMLRLGLGDIQEGLVELTLNVENHHTNFYGIAHGGALMSVADTAMGAACLSCNKKVVTMSFNMNFIKAIPEGKAMKAIGRVLHNGSRTMACEVELWDEDGRLLSKGNGSFFVMGEFIPVNTPVGDKVQA